MYKMPRWNITIISVKKNTCSMVLTSRDELLAIETLDGHSKLFSRKNLSSQEEDITLLSDLAFEGKVDAASLAYNCDQDTSYLLLGNPLQIYNINDLSAPVYPQPMHGDLRVKLGPSQITFATNNSLFISTLNDGTMKFDLSTHMFQKVSKLYSPPAGHYYQVINGKKYEFWKGQKQVKVTDLDNGNEDNLTLDYPALDHEECPMAAYKDGFYFWDYRKGISKIDLTGNITTFLDINAIDNAPDYQCLFRSVRNLATNQNKIFALGIPSAGKILILRPSSMK